MPKSLILAAIFLALTGISAGDDATDMAIIIARAKAGIKTPLPQAPVQQQTVSAARMSPDAGTAPVLLLFTSPVNCPPCYLVENDCLTNWRVRLALGRFSFSKMGPASAADYQISRWPTLWYISHGKAWQYPCPTDPTAMAAALNGIADRMK